MPRDAALPIVTDAPGFLAVLREHADPAERAKLQRALTLPPRRVLLGVRMRTVFDLAAANVALPLDVVEALLADEVHEARVGALSVLAKKASAKRTAPAELETYAALYLRRHDDIDTWDLVDLAAHHVLGRFVADRPRDVLDDLAASPHPFRRRSAMFATLHLVRRGELDDTYRIASALLADDDEGNRRTVGGLLREAGKQDEPRLVAFLEQHAAAMPAIMLRFATERLPPTERARLRGLR